jgi:ABC-type Fe3+/spermidine/putrescine transport system ATPase subunit
MIERADGAPEIRLTQLAKHFRDVRAVDRVSLDIGSGEFFSLLGPSGCGKTTTLRMIGGFELPTAGRIELPGRDVTLDPPDKRPVNMVFQNYALFPHLDVAANISIGLRRPRPVAPAPTPHGPRPEAPAPTAHCPPPDLG